MNATAKEPSAPVSVHADEPLNVKVYRDLRHIRVEGWEHRFGDGDLAISDAVLSVLEGLGLPVVDGSDPNADEDSGWTCTVEMGVCWTLPECPCNAEVTA